MPLDSHYVLDKELELVKANPKDFAIHYSTYRENIFFRQSWVQRVSIFSDGSPCYWITFNKRRIGGACIEPNMLHSLFFEPPFVDMFRVLAPLKRFVISCSEPNKPIQAYGILPYQAEHFLRLGFLPSESRRVMIRPTERFDRQTWGEELGATAPDSEQTDTIAEMLFHSYSGSDGIGYTIGNPAEALYYRLGFYPGMIQTTFDLPLRNGADD